MRESLLIVDDEASILEALRRTFIDDDIEVLTAKSAAEAADIIRKREVSVIISDMRMPGASGIEFLEMARQCSPDTVRIMLTGHADLSMAMEAINRGEVYKFLTKPWESEALRQVVVASIEKYRLIKELRASDEATLLSLAQAVELKDSYTRGHCERVAGYAIAIAEKIGLPAEKCKELRYGSWLHDCGKIGVPESILNQPGPLTEFQLALVRQHSQWGADVAKAARLGEAVIKIILHHHERYDGDGYPGGLKGRQIPMGARIVAIADVYDALTSDRSYRRAYSLADARQMMLERRGTEFDPELTDILLSIVEVANGI